MIKLKTPFSEEKIKELEVGDMVLISGDIYCGRDAVLPQIVEMAKKNLLKIKGMKKISYFILKIHCLNV